MTIVWVNKRDWKHPGPIVNMSVHNAHSFAAAGLPSHLCLGAGSTESDISSDLQDFYGLQPLPHFHVHRIPRVKGRLGGSASSAVYRQAVQTIRELARHDDVAVFTRECGFLARLAWLCRSPRIRGFYELHDLWADLSWRDQRPKLRDHREKWLERLFLPHLSGLVCITHEMEKRYRQLFPRQATIALPLGTKPHLGVEVEARRQARTVFYVGHMHGPKGADFLLKAASTLAAHQVRTEFWGGYDKDARHIQQAAASQGLSDWIHAVPFRPPAELHAALAQRASLGVVMLADTYYNRYLTCPVKALDYLSHGIPALGTDIPSVREVLDDAGIYLPEGDLDTFVSRTLQLLDDPAAYAAAAARTQARAEEITWLQRAQALIGFAANA